MPDVRTQSFKKSIIDIMGGMDAINEQLDPIKNAVNRFAATNVGKKFSRGVLSTIGYTAGENGGKWFWRSIPEAFSTGIAENGLAVGIARGAMHTAGALFGPAFVAMDMYKGYRENGITGALVGGAKGVLEMGMWELVDIGSLLPAAPIAATAMIGYGVGEAAIAHQKKLRRLEMGMPQIDRFGTIATSRQRSLQALQKTHINGRLALGNEALLMHY